MNMKFQLPHLHRTVTKGSTEVSFRDILQSFERTERLVIEAAQQLNSVIDFHIMTGSVSICLVRHGRK